MTRRRSLRQHLLRAVLVPLGILSLFGAVAGYFTVRNAIDAANDKTLAAAALAISEHLRMGDGRPEVDLPPVALEMLDTVDQDRVFYAVSWRSAQGEAFLTGYDDLPRAPDAQPGKTIFYNSEYRGERIRVAALYTAMAASPPVIVVTEVAETLNGRNILIRNILAQAFGQQLLLVLVGTALVWFGVTRGLMPLREVSAEVARRTATDLAPLPPHHGPEELSPLIDAVDQLMTRLREAIAQQRRFIADAAHQLRTPLAVLRTQAESALREQEPAAIRQALAQLRDHSQATSRLATQLLSMARAEPAADVGAELVDLAAIAREACTVLVPEAIAHGADLGFESSGSAAIHAQPLLVRELIANLIDNAVRYAPGARITVGVARRDSAALLSVEDDGPGIAPAERSRVFERFYRVRGTQGDGAGLGLAIVREIAQRYGGSVTLLDGGQGRGLRVEVRFPAAADAHAAGAA